MGHSPLEKLLRYILIARQSLRRAVGFLKIDDGPNRWPEILLNCNFNRVLWRSTAMRFSDGRKQKQITSQLLWHFKYGYPSDFGLSSSRVHISSYESLPSVSTLVGISLKQKVPILARGV